MLCICSCDLMYIYMYVVILHFKLLHKKKSCDFICLYYFNATTFRVCNFWLDIRFSSPLYVVHEDRGPAKLKLVLDQAGVESMTIQVITTSITATGECVCMHVHMYECMHVCGGYWRYIHIVKTITSALHVAIISIKFTFCVCL